MTRDELILLHREICELRWHFELRIQRILDRLQHHAKESPEKSRERRAKEVERL